MPSLTLFHPHTFTHTLPPSHLHSHSSTLTPSHTLLSSHLHTFFHPHTFTHSSTLTPSLIHLYSYFTLTHTPLPTYYTLTPTHTPSTPHRLTSHSNSNCPQPYWPLCVELTTETPSQIRAGTQRWGERGLCVVGRRGVEGSGRGVIASVVSSVSADLEGKLIRI